MIPPSPAFERYRRAAGERTTLPWLAAGTLIVAVFWVAASFAALVIGARLSGPHPAGAGKSGTAETMTAFLASSWGLTATLLSFLAIWTGLWAAMRLLHREPLCALFGAGQRVSWNGFAKGFVAIILTSSLSEALIYLLRPEIVRGSVAPGAWLLALAPLAGLTLIQTSAEEALFRGYLMRGLAARFSSPLVWFALPVAAFTLLHWGASANPTVHLAGLLSIGAFALVLAATVWLTGNLGAAFGAHMANNLFGFALISHQESYGALALFAGASLEAPGWTTLDAVQLALIGLGCSALTLLLLVHPRSPLKLGTEPADALEPASRS